MSRIPRVILPSVVLLLNLGTTALAGTPSGRVLSIGDIHGAYGPLVEILQTAGVVDRQARWIGGDTTLVQSGDFLDRGAGALEVMDLLMRLQEEAPRHGGQVIVLLGNHEVMNLLGVMRDVSPEVFDRLAGPDSEARQDRLYRAAVELFRSHYRKADLPDDFEEQWKRRHPPGFLEYCRLLAPEGRYGRWLRTLPSAVKLDDMFFIHAGLSLEMSVPDAGALTARVSEDLAFFDAYRALLLDNGLVLPVTTYGKLSEIARGLVPGGGVALASLNGSKGEVRRMTREFLHRKDNWTLTAISGPLWFRGFAKWRPAEGARNVKALARGLGVEHFVVGHSPVRDRAIHHRFNGAVFLTDTGMLSEHYHGGRPSALERVGERWTAIYADGREVVWGPGPREALAESWPGPDGDELPLRSDDEALEFLRKAKIGTTRMVGSGVNRTLKVELTHDGVRAHGAFRSVDLKRNRVRLGQEIFLDFHDSYRYEVAAYEFSRLLGLDAIPPVVIREVNGEKGSLQLWVERATTESEMHQAQDRPPDWTSWYRQLQTMRLFDRLIYNFDRHRGNILVGDDWRLWMIDHTRSFRMSTEVPEITSVTHCEKDLWRRIRELTEDEVREQLKPHAGPRQVKALMKRRDKVVKHIKELIARFGEEHVIFDVDAPPLPEETVHLAEGRIESFLDGLPDESEVPEELRTTASSE